MWTAICGYTDIAELLIASGADVNAKDNIGNTAFKYAASRYHAEFLDLLEESGAIE